MEAEAAEKLRDRAAEQERLRQAAAQRVVQQLVTLVPAIEPAAYMKAKGIGDTRIESHPSHITCRIIWTKPRVKFFYVNQKIQLDNED
jgi:hypothetical protein